MTNSGLLLNHPEMAAWFESAGNQAAFFCSVMRRATAGRRLNSPHWANHGGPVILQMKLKRDEVIVLRCGITHDDDSVNGR